MVTQTGLILAPRLGNVGECLNVGTPESMRMTLYKMVVIVQFAAANGYSQPACNTTGQQRMTGYCSMKSYQIHESGYRSATRHMSSGQTPAARLGGLIVKAVIAKLVLLAIATMLGIDVYPLVMSAIHWFVR